MNTKDLLSKLNANLEPPKAPTRPMTQEEYNAGLDRLAEKINASFANLKEQPKEVNTDDIKQS